VKLNLVEQHNKELEQLYKKAKKDMNMDFLLLGNAIVMAVIFGMA